jgi:hypothetical protein
MNSTPADPGVVPSTPPMAPNANGNNVGTNGSHPQQNDTQNGAFDADKSNGEGSPGHNALATCDLCREHGGCDHKFRVRSVLPKSGEEDPELFLGRTKLYELMDTLQIEYSCMGGRRVMDGASKCRYYRANMNKPTTRGGDRKSKEARVSARRTEVEPAATSSTPIRPATAGPVQSSPYAQVAEIPDATPDKVPADAMGTTPAQPTNTGNQVSSPADASTKVANSSNKIPDPPRRADGKIDWDKISDEFFSWLLNHFRQVQIAEAWGIAPTGIYQQIVKRKAKGQLKGVREDAFRRAPLYIKPSKFVLFAQLWSMPATHIAEKNECSQATVLVWANEYELKGPLRPGHRFWQREKSGIKVEATPEAKALYAMLRAEATPEEALLEIPKVFRTSEPSVTAAVDEPQRASANNNEQSQTGRGRIALKFSIAELLEELWRNPRTRVAERYKIPSSTLSQKIRKLGLSPYLPPEDHWQNRKSGDPVSIPERIQTVIARFRAEDNGCSKELSRKPAQDSAETVPVQQPSSSSPTIDETQQHSDEHKGQMLSEVPATPNANG